MLVLSMNTVFLNQQKYPKMMYTHGHILNLNHARQPVAVEFTKELSHVITEQLLKLSTIVSVILMKNPKMFKNVIKKHVLHSGLKVNGASAVKPVAIMEQKLVKFIAIVLMLMGKDTFKLITDNFLNKLKEIEFVI